MERHGRSNLWVGWQRREFDIGPSYVRCPTSSGYIACCVGDKKCKNVQLPIDMKVLRQIRSTREGVNRQKSPRTKPPGVTAFRGWGDEEEGMVTGEENGVSGEVEGKPASVQIFRRNTWTRPCVKCSWWVTQKTTGTSHRPSQMEATGALWGVDLEPRVKTYGRRDMWLRIDKSCQGILL